jgi:hypothetical protein
MDDLSEKPCRCGETMGEVIGFKDRVTDGHLPDVQGCAGTAQSVMHWTKQFFRETVIDTN